MAKINIDMWKQDKAKRDARTALGLCPMCGRPKRPEDLYDSDYCKKTDQDGLSSWGE